MFDDDFLTRVYVWKDLIGGVFLIFILVFSYFTGCSVINKELNLENDNIAEQFAEQLIESKLGIEVDLTPNDDI